MANQSLLELFPSPEVLTQEGNTPPTAIEQRSYLVAGEMKSFDGKTHQVYSPVHVHQDGKLSPVYLGSYPLLEEPAAMEVLEAAVKAYDNGRGEWPTMSVGKRIECMEIFTRKMIALKETVVNLIMWEIGKSREDSTKEFDRTIVYIEDTIDQLKDLDRTNSRFVIEQGIVGQIRRAPLGVVLCMGPFNYPLNETYTTLIPALIMGNTVVFKPPKHGTLLHFPLLEAFRTSFPKGVVNTLYGRGNQVVPSLMESGKINALALIGSSRVADQLKKQHPKSNRLRAILGLDAKNAAIILEDAPIDVTVQEVVLGALSFNGQRCTAIKIVYVHRSIAHLFTQKLAEAVDKLRLGMPFQKGVQITPLPEPTKPEYLKGLINDALENGAQIINQLGGQAEGSLVAPTVLYPCNKKMRIFREEQFGPIVPVIPFDDVEEPIQNVIDSEHGQQVSIFGRDSGKLATLIDPLVNQVCRVNINTQCQRGPDTFPFSGRKDSAEGTLSVLDALRSFSIRTLVAAKATPENKALLTEIVENHKSNFLSTKFIL